MMVRILIFLVGVSQCLEEEESGRSFGVFKAEVRDSNIYPISFDPTKINKVTCGSYYTIMDQSTDALTVSADVCLLGLMAATFGAIPLLLSMQENREGGLLNMLNTVSRQLADTDFDLTKDKFDIFQQKLISQARNRILLSVVEERENEDQKSKTSEMDEEKDGEIEVVQEEFIDNNEC